MQTFTFYASEDKLSNRGNDASSKYGVSFPVILTINVIKFIDYYCKLIDHKFIKLLVCYYLDIITWKQLLHYLLKQSHHTPPFSAGKEKRKD